MNKARLQISIDDKEDEDDKDEKDDEEIKNTEEIKSSEEDDLEREAPKIEKPNPEGESIAPTKMSPDTMKEVQALEVE